MANVRLRVNQKLLPGNVLWWECKDDELRFQMKDFEVVMKESEVYYFERFDNEYVVLVGSATPDAKDYRSGKKHQGLQFKNMHNEEWLRYA